MTKMAIRREPMQIQTQIQIMIAMVQKKGMMILGLNEKVMKNMKETETEIERMIYIEEVDQFKRRETEIGIEAEVEKKIEIMTDLEDQNHAIQEEEVGVEVGAEVMIEIGVDIEIEIIEDIDRIEIIIIVIVIVTVTVIVIVIDGEDIVQGLEREADQEVDDYKFNVA